MRLSKGAGNKGLSTMDKPLEQHNTRQELAAAAGVSTGTLEIYNQTVGRPNKEKTVLSTMDNTVLQHNTQQELAAAAGVSTGTLASESFIC